MEYEVIKTVIHPEYDETFVDNDVALLKFSTDNKDDVFGESILMSRDQRRSKQKQNKKSKSSISFTPACLPEQGEELPVNSKETKCMIMGWGKSKESDAFGNDILQQAEVRTKNKFKDLRYIKGTKTAG